MNRAADVLDLRTEWAASTWAAEIRYAERTEARAEAMPTGAFRDYLLKRARAARASAARVVATNDHLAARWNLSELADELENAATEAGAADLPETTPEEWRWTLAPQTGVSEREMAA